MFLTEDQKADWTPHNQPSFGPEEETAASRVLRSGWVAPGPEVAAFEREFSEFLGLEEGCAVAVSSGSSALFLSLWALDLGNKKISTPVYACSALRNAIGLVRSQPEFVDCEEASPQMDIQSIQEKKSDAVFFAHLFGFAGEVESLNAEKVIEDVAQGLGAKLNGKFLGTFGRCSIFSFYASKLMTTGGHGGIFVAKERALADRVRDYIQFDGRRDEKLRFNFQMTDLQAAIGRAQLKKFPDLLRRRREIYSIYQKAGLPLLKHAHENEGAFYRCVLRIKNPKGVQDALLENKIRSIVPIEDWEIQSQDEKQFPNAFQISRTSLSLPIFPNLTNEKAKEISEIVLRTAEGI